MMSVSVGSAEAGNARTAIPVVSSCLEKRATLGKAQFRHRYRSMQACSQPRSVVLDRFNRANTDTLQPIWEGTPYRLSYSDIAATNRQATQFDASRNYSVAQWKQPVAVTKAFAVTMRNGFNSPNRHPSLDNHELFLNIAHDLGDLTIVPTAWLSPLGGYELGVYAGYDRAGNEDFGNAMWKLYRFDVPGYTTLSTAAWPVRAGDKIALAFDGTTVSGMLKPAGKRWRVVTSSGDDAWADAVGKPAFHMTPGYSVDNASLLTMKPNRRGRR